MSVEEVDRPVRCHKKGGDIGEVGGPVRRMKRRRESREPVERRSRRRVEEKKKTIQSRRRSGRSIGEVDRAVRCHKKEGEE